jgi:hypothetical protein
MITITGLQFGELIAFSIVTETILQWPSMGNLLLTSMYENDQPVIVTYYYGGIEYARSHTELFRCRSVADQTVSGYDDFHWKELYPLNPTG